jgi:hypothetical protein
MKKIQLLILFVGVIFRGLQGQNQPSEGAIILDRPGFPFIFELNTGESCLINRSYNGTTVGRRIKLLGFQAYSEPNYWFTDPVPPSDYYQFRVDLDVSGEKISIFHRPYQMPVKVNGLRIYIENMKDWGKTPSGFDRDSLTRQVRIAVCLADEPWGPGDIIFPVNNYRWRANVYNNTWSSLVPYNFLYYHRGEDYGAIPDLLDLAAPISGKILVTPLSGKKSGSNEIVIGNTSGLKFNFYHMDLETIVQDYTAGTRIEAGSVFAKTGMTWDGRKAQGTDPHVHVDLDVDNVKVASFPYLMEAYLRKYPDPVFAVAGGYRFAEPGKQVILDGGLSFTRDMAPVKNYQWKLSNGKIIKTPEAVIIYDKPGLYAEELLVETEEGYQDRDFLSVRVYDPKKGKDIADGYGWWAYYYPLRGIKPGTPVLFWNRLDGTKSDVRINYGDDSAWEIIDREATHKFRKPGSYVVTLQSTFREDEPLTLKMEVIVE